MDVTTPLPNFEYWAARAPNWVVPAPIAVRDLTLLAGHLYHDKPTDALHGVTVALAWVLGDGHGPITGRTEQPVTRNLAEGEWTAGITADGPIFDLGPDYARLGVANVPTRPHASGYCVGVSRTLRWLLDRPEKECKPPLTVPRRHADGRPFTVDDLYAEAMAQPLAKFRYDLVEDRDKLYWQCHADAAKYHRLAEWIDALD